MEVVFGAYRVFKNDSDYIKEVNYAVEFTQSQVCKEQYVMVVYQGKC